MKNTILNDIKEHVTNKLKYAYGYCGVAENDQIIVINSSDKKGNDIKITIQLDPE